MVHRRDALAVQYMLLVLQLQNLVSEFVLNCLADIMEAAGGPAKSHLWDQFIQNKSEPIITNDIQFPPIHAFSLSPMVTMETIITMIRRYSAAHEDELAQLQSDLPFFLQKVKSHRDAQESFKQASTAEITRRVEEGKVSCSEFRALVPEFETRIVWHIFLEIFERPNEALAPDKHKVADAHDITDEHDIAERLTREAYMTVRMILLARLDRLKPVILTSNFGKRRISAVAASVCKKRKIPVQSANAFEGSLNDLRRQSLGNAFDLFGDAELSEEDWFLWSSIILSRDDQSSSHHSGGYFSTCKDTEIWWKSYHMTLSDGLTR
jgi:hypothetical protein